MNSVALTGQRNFPITTDALAFMQGAYGMLENFSKLAGDNYILSGCTVTGASVSSGMVVIGSRLMPFAGGSIQENVKVVTTITTITVGAGSREQTSYSAEFGTSTNPVENIGWGTLSANRIENMLSIKAGLAAINNSLVDINNALSVQNRLTPFYVGMVNIDGTITHMAGEPVVVTPEGGVFFRFQGDFGVDYTVNCTVQQAGTSVIPFSGVVVFEKTENSFYCETFRWNGDTMQAVGGVGFSVQIYKSN